MPTKTKIKNGRSAEALRREIVKFLSTHNVSLSALARASDVSQPNLQSSVTLKIRFNPTQNTADNIRAAMKKIAKYPNRKY